MGITYPGTHSLVITELEIGVGVGAVLFLRPDSGVHRPWAKPFQN